jgi:hypothetical protein
VSAPPCIRLKPNSIAIADVEDQVKIVIQVAGMNTLVRPDPRDEDKILWYRQVRVFCSYPPLHVELYWRSC